MGLEVEIWNDSIQEKLLKDNTFLTAVADVSSENILNGTVVHLPQAGAPSKVVKNRTTFPAEVKRRLDGQVLYAIDEYTTDPVHISNRETVEYSYGKRKSVLDQDIANLSQEVAEGMLTNFIVSPVGDNPALPTANILETTGDAVLATAAGATGNRRASTLSDVQRVGTFLKRNLGWSEGNMYGLLPAEMEAQLFPANSALTATYMASVSEAERRAGVIYSVQGIKLFSRSSAYILGADKSFKAFGAVGSATDCEGALFWNKNMLEKAIGATQAFETIGDPTYYGDIYSFLVRMGGRARRKNYEGVVVLKQATTA